MGWIKERLQGYRLTKDREAKIAHFMGSRTERSDGDADANGSRYEIGQRNGRHILGINLDRINEERELG